MNKDHTHQIKNDKRYAAVCGLYCEACALFIATTQDPERLKNLAKAFNVSEEEVKWYGCRSEKRGPYCKTCKMDTCAAQKGFDFCHECEEYPCKELKRFKSVAPHRIEIFENLAKIKQDGYQRWMIDARKNHECPACNTLNSAYDLKCRTCGMKPSCNYVSKYQTAIKNFMEKK